MGRAPPAGLRPRMAVRRGGQRALLAPPSPSCAPHSLARAPPARRRPCCCARFSPARPPRRGRGRTWRRRRSHPPAAAVPQPRRVRPRPRRASTCRWQRPACTQARPAAAAAGGGPWRGGGGDSPARLTPTTRPPTPFRPVDPSFLFGAAAWLPTMALTLQLAAQPPLGPAPSPPPSPSPPPPTPPSPPAPPRLGGYNVPRPPPAPAPPPAQPASPLPPLVPARASATDQVLVAGCARGVGWGGGGRMRGQQPRRCRCRAAPLTPPARGARSVAVTRTSWFMNGLYSPTGATCVGRPVYTNGEGGGACTRRPLQFCSVFNS